MTGPWMETEALRRGALASFRTDAVRRSSQPIVVQPFRAGPRRGWIGADQTTLGLAT
jgi:hypothetical protein